MGTLTRDAIRSVIHSLMKIDDDTDRQLVDSALFDTVIDEFVTDAGTAATADAETPVFVADRYLTVKAVKITAPVAVADDAANTAQIKVGTKTGAAATRVAAEWDTTTGQQGALAANVPANAPLSVTPANLVLAPGDQLTVALAKTGLGVAVAGATGAGVNIQIVLTDQVHA